VVGEADLGLFAARLDALVGQPVAPKKGHEHAGGSSEVAPARRPLPVDVALVGDYRRLVDGDPVVGQGAKLKHHPIDVGGEAFGRPRRVPAACLSDPGRVSEMVQGDHWLEPGRPQRLEDVSIVRYRHG
jgi:hypothetical protein